MSRPLPPLAVRATRLRIFNATGVALFACLIVAGNTPTAADLSFGVITLVVLALLVGFFAAAWLSGAIRRGGELLVAPDGLTAPHTTTASVGGLMGAGGGALGSMLGSSTANGHRRLEIVLVIATVLFIAFFLVVARRGGFRLVLTPDGLDLPRFLGSKHVPWEALRSGSPAALNNNVVSIWVAGRTVHVRPPLVRATFLAAAIRYYIDHPGEQAGIGDPGNYERMLVMVATVPTRPVEREFTLQGWKSE